MIPTQWIRNGDRSDPNLQRLDSLVLTYPGWQEDFRAAEEAHTTNVHSFDEALHRLREKQRIHQGDRTHPRLTKLDALHLTYPGFEFDKKEAEEYHVETLYRRWDDYYGNMLEALKIKQSLFEGDRSHPKLVKLDALTLNYPGWQSDFREAEQSLTNNVHDFEQAYHRLTAKQNMFVGDRSHPRLLKLDGLKLTYPGNERDIREAEDFHVDTPYGRFDGYFDSQIEALRNKEALHRGHRSHPGFAKLDALNLSYPDWELDFRTAEEALTTNVYDFELPLHRLTSKQAMFEGDRSHPRLVALDALRLDYPGWERDVKEAEEHHVNTVYGRFDGYFENELQALRNKQVIYQGYRNREAQRACENHHNDDDENTTTTRDGERSESSSAPATGGAAGASGAKTSEDLGLCIICLEASKSHAFVPCGHLCVCQSCAATSIERNRQCPLCRGKAENSIRVFF